MESILKVNSELNQQSINKFIKRNEYNLMVALKVSDFNKKFLKGLKIIENEGQPINNRLYYRIGELLDYVNYKLNIETFDKYRQIMAFIESSEILLDRGIEDKDLECLSTGFYGLKSNLENI